MHWQLLLNLLRWCEFWRHRLMRLPRRAVYDEPANWLLILLLCDCQKWKIIHFFHLLTYMPNCLSGLDSGWTLILKSDTSLSRHSTIALKDIHIIDGSSQHVCLACVSWLFRVRLGWYLALACTKDLAINNTIRLMVGLALLTEVVIQHQ